MPITKARFRGPIALCLVLFSAQFSFAQLSSKGPTTWWPDPSTGLMWTGYVPLVWINWAKANGYCTSTKLGGFSDWRLPTLNEVKAITTYHHVVPEEHTRDTGPRLPHNSAIIHDKGPDFPDPPYDALVFKGDITAPDEYYIWTTTPAGDQQVSTLYMGQPDLAGQVFKGGDAHVRISKLTDDRFHTAICVRPMEPDLLQIAKDAQVSRPVPDIQTLKSNVPLTKAKLAYQAAQYRDSITQSQAALAIKSDFAPAYWAIGISFGRQGQWDQAVSNLEAALKIDKGYNNAKTSLKWAKAGQKAAKKGTSPKEQPPVWN